MTVFPSGDSLDRSMARAVAWNAAAKWSSQILSWVSTIVVARLLTPYDYGVVGMAGLYLALATLISQTGIGGAVLTFRDLTRRQLAELNTVALLIGTTLVGLSCLLALPIARFFSSPPLRAVILVASITYLLNGFQVIPQALLQKELRFRLLASIDTTRVVCQIVVTIVLAWLNFRYWSLVLGGISSCLTGTILTVYFRRHEFAMPRFARLRRELTFGRHTLTGGLAWYVYDNADFGVAGRVLGGVPLGNYTIAWQIASAPVAQIANLVTGVMPAFFSAVQGSKAELRRYLLRLTEVLSLATIPASIGIALTADYLVPVVLGPKWHGAIGPLRLLGIFIAVRCLAVIPSKLLSAIGDTRFTMWATIGWAIVMPIAFLMGSRWGASGIAAAWVIAYPPMMAPMFFRAFQKTETNVKEYFSAVLPALAASAVMAAAVILIRTIVPASPHSSVYLFLLVIIGMASYTGALFIFFRARITRVVYAVRYMRKEKKHSEELASEVDTRRQAELPLGVESNLFG
jgi:O-antigen/teichoic acid export membrane protein